MTHFDKLQNTTTCITLYIVGVFLPVIWWTFCLRDKHEWNSRALLWKKANSAGSQIWFLTTLGVGKLWPMHQIRPATCFCRYNFIRTQSCPVVYILSVAASTLQWQSWVVVTETIRTISLKKFTLCCFTEKVCQPLD